MNGQYRIDHGLATILALKYTSKYIIHELRLESKYNILRYLHIVIKYILS